MAEITIRNLDEEALNRLEARARANGHSLEEEIVMILERYSTLDMEEARKLVDRIAERFERDGRRFDDSAQLIREDRER